MNKIHEKSPCCRGDIRRYGRRRRQCSICHKTWSVWQKKRGRKRIRVNIVSAVAFIEHCRTPIRKQAGTRNKNQYRLARSRQHLVSTVPWPSVPQKGNLIVVADALVKYLEKGWHAWYLILVRHYEEGKRIYELVKTVLTAPDEQILAPVINELEEISWTSNSPGIRTVLGGFVNHYQDYRTYLTRSDLRLPTTNNTAETLVGLIEELSRRGRGFRTVQTFNKWIAAIIKIRKTVRCR